MNERDEIKICDFGSAKVLDRNGMNSPYVVTQYYRAPELLFSHTNYDTSIDMWGKKIIFVKNSSWNNNI